MEKLKIEVGIVVLIKKMEKAGYKFIAYEGYQDVYLEFPIEIGQMQFELKFPFKNEEDMMEAVKENRKVVLEDENLVAYFMAINPELEGVFGEHGGDFIFINSKKTKYIPLGFNSFESTFFTKSIGDEVSLQAIIIEIFDVLYREEDKWLENDTSYEFYYGIKDNDNCSCRGGGCPSCEPHRFVN